VLIDEEPKLARQIEVGLVVEITGGLNFGVRQAAEPANLTSNIRIWESKLFSNSSLPFVR
jgi:hypothetical protein